MRLLTLFVFTLLAALLPASGASAVEIPEFTPNVVDPDHVLTPTDTEQVNQALLKLRNEQQIWGAVYIVPSLDGGSIEDLANHAFETWQLGRKGDDNGLLLVLAIKQHRSRFEVGYGLEGALPDVVARHALDDALAPRMRQGDTAGAIVAAFDFMAKVAAGDPQAIQSATRLDASGDSDTGFVWSRGAIAWGGLLVLVWGVPLAGGWWRKHCRRRLLRRHPELAAQAGPDEDIARHDPASATAAGYKRTSNILVRLFIPGFLTLNPGVFVWLLSAKFVGVFVALICIEPVILALIFHRLTQRYRTAQRYRAFQQELADSRRQLLRKRHIVEASPGEFVYTQAYYKALKASEAAAARNSSGSSSSGSSSSGGSGGSSSSSGGGSSGGGGSSSSW